MNRPRVMSVIPLKAGIHQRGLHSRLVPLADLADRHRVSGRLPSRPRLLLTAELLRAQSAPNYFIVIASPLRSAFAISPTCRPERSRMAPFWRGTEALGLGCIWDWGFLGGSGGGFKELTLVGS